MRLLQPEILSVFLTSACTAACRHCCTSSGPERKDSIHGDLLEAILAQVFEAVTPPPKVVAFTGGEPFLRPAELLRGVAFCSARGAGTRVVTNAFFATSPPAAIARLRPLRDAGLCDLTISTDDHHLPWVSLQRVRNAVEAATELELPAVVVSTCTGPESLLTPDGLEAALGPLRRRFSDDGQPALATSTPRGARILSNARTLALGRGALRLREDELHAGAGSDAVGACPWVLRWPAVSPNAHLLACCGFELEGNLLLDLGDLSREPLEDLLDRADSDLPANTLAALGPAGIRRVLEDVCPGEVRFSRPHYRGMCELCADLVLDPRNRRAFLRHLSVFAEPVLRWRQAVRPPEVRP